MLSHRKNEEGQNTIPTPTLDEHQMANSPNDFIAVPAELNNNFFFQPSSPREQEAAAYMATSSEHPSGLLLKS